MQVEIHVQDGRIMYKYATQAENVARGGAYCNKGVFIAIWEEFVAKGR